MKNLLKKMMIGTAVGVGILSTCGCETPEQTRALGVLMQLGAANSRNNLTYDQRVGASIIGNALENQAQDQAMIRAAREGRDQIVINVPQQTQSYQEQVSYNQDNALNIPKDLSRFALTFNKWVDRNNDNTIDLNNELINVKDVFRPGEQVEAYCEYETIERVRGKKFTLRLFNPENKMIQESSVITPFENYFTERTTIGTIEEKDLEGIYTIEWYCGNNKLYSHQFRVIK